MNAMLRRMPVWTCAGLLALAIPAAANAAPASAAATPQAVSADKLSALCSNCAIVREVKTETRKGKGGALGLAGGAVVGGVIGHQIGGGIGKTLATVGGAAAGAYAGNEVQKSTSKTTVWLTRVTLKDGSVRTFENSSEPGFKAGDVVVIDGATIKRR
jgi:outer membrane lipoprotein SlyB